MQESCPGTARQCDAVAGDQPGQLGRPAGIPPGDALDLFTEREPGTGGVVTPQASHPQFDDNTAFTDRQIGQLSQW